MSETDTGNTQIDKRVECVVLPGDRRSGISCDWANATKETDEWANISNLRPPARTARAD